MYDTKTVLGSYLYQLTIRQVKTGNLHGQFSFGNLFKNLKDYKLVDKDLDDKSYGELVVAVRNEWNSIKHSVINEQK